MKKSMKSLLGVFCAALLTLTGCGQTANQPTAASSDEPLKVVATTTMLADLARNIGGEYVDVSGLMGPGIDPHLYQASAGDVSLMQQADVVIYNGLHLEGKMGEIFQSLSTRGDHVICIENGLEPSQLLSAEGSSDIPDPHIWFDVSLWKSAAQTVSDGLSKANRTHTDTYQANLKAYLTELEELDAYIHSRAEEIPQQQRVLVTAHDAFQYFGRAYGFEVKGLQGISTDAEAGTADVSTLADFIVERKIKAIFVESSVPPKTIQALQAAIRAKGFESVIGGELYSDSLGDAESGTDTYITSFKANIDTIVDALK